MSARISLRGLRRLIWVDTLRRGQNVGLSRWTADNYMQVSVHSYLRTSTLEINEWRYLCATTETVLTNFDPSYICLTQIIYTTKILHKQSTTKPITLIYYLTNMFYHSSLQAYSVNRHCYKYIIPVYSNLSWFTFLLGLVAFKALYHLPLDVPIDWFFSNAFLFKLLISWCFMPLSMTFQLYHGVFLVS